MTAKSLASVALTADAFRPFGAVLMAFGPAPERYAYAGNIENRRDQAKANLTFIHAPAKPALIGAVERHAFSSQTFVPMNGVRYLVGVCPPTADGGPDVALRILSGHASDAGGEPLVAIGPGSVAVVRVFRKAANGHAGRMMVPPRAAAIGHTVARFGVCGLSAPGSLG